MKPHHIFPRIVILLANFHDGWIVGGSAEWFVNGMQGERPRDIDLLIPLENWNRASTLIPKGSFTNSFGGIKVDDFWKDSGNSVKIDIWSQSLSDFIFNCIKPITIFNPKTNINFQIK